MRSRTSSPRRTVGFFAAGALVAAGLTVVPAGAVVAENLFELDGNTTLDTGGPPPDDWDELYTGGGSALVGTIAPDPAGETIFTTGASKDDLGIQGEDTASAGWAWTSGSVPDKNEITNAYTAAYIDNSNGTPELIVYFGADRFAVNGNSNIGFWFFQNDVAPDGYPDASSGGFTDQHVIGDVLVLSEFTNGGTVPTVDVYKWDPTDPTAINGTLVPLVTPGAGGADCTNEPLDQDACAEVNADTITVPWPYQNKSNKFGPNEVPAGGFFEGGINLTALFGGNEDIPCISSFLAETRSSQSVDATLKDFAFGDFDLCGADLTIAGTETNEVGDAHTFTATATQNFGGQSTAAEDGTQVLVSLATANGAALDNVDMSAMNNCDIDTDGDTSTIEYDGEGTVGGDCVVTFTSNSAGTITGTATADIFVGDRLISASTPAPAVKTYVDAKISIAADDTNEVNENHTWTVTFQQDAGDGSGFVNVPGGTTVTVSLQDANGSAASASSDGCANPGTSGGQCSVTFTSATAGTVTGSATGSVTVDGVSLSRTTDGSGSNGGTTTKQFVDARILISPDDTNGIGENHTFTVTFEQDAANDGLGWTDVPDGTDVDVTLTDGGGASASVSSDTCDVDGGGAGTVNGQCTVTFTSATAGTVTGSASGTVTINGLSVSRSTNGTAPNSDTVVKTFVDGSLTWMKVDDGQPPLHLGGAEFEVCLFAYWNSETGAFEADLAEQDEVCVDVTDNEGQGGYSGLDTDDRAGYFKLEELTLGKYRITETVAPTGYVKDDTPQTVELSLEGENLPGPDGSAGSAFVNPALFKLIVLTCNTATETLEVSEVDLDGNILDTISAVPSGLQDKGVSQAELCDLGGASYDNLTRDTYTPSVTIPKPATP